MMAVELWEGQKRITVGQTSLGFRDGDGAHGNTLPMFNAIEPHTYDS